jgi:tetratricopeptide (TPR) repeat protein
MRVFLVIFPVLSLLLDVRSTEGQMSVPVLIDSGSALTFAETLYQERKYYSAITEYKRYIFHYPEADEVNFARLRIGLAYKQGKRWDNARVWLGEARGAELLSAQLAIAEIYLAQRQLVMAEYVFAQLLGQIHSNSERARVRFERAKIYLNAFEFEKAMEEFEEIGTVYSETLEGRKARLFARKIAVNQVIPYRSPRVAKVLSSILPGGGQIYAGQIKDGFNAALLNALLGFMTFRAIHTKSYLTGTWLGLMVWPRYYLGNVNNAGKAAMSFNRRIRVDYVKSL